MPCGGDLKRSPHLSFLGLAPLFVAVLASPKGCYGGPYRMMSVSVAWSVCVACTESLGRSGAGLHRGGHSVHVQLAGRIPGLPNSRPCWAEQSPALQTQISLSCCVSSSFAWSPHSGAFACMCPNVKLSKSTFDRHAN